MGHEGIRIIGTTRMWPVGVKRPPLSARKRNPGYPLNTKPGGPPSHSERYEDGKTFLNLPGNEP
jgi:hypothetical protein